MFEEMRRANIIQMLSTFTQKLIDYRFREGEHLTDRHYLHLVRSERSLQPSYKEHIEKRFACVSSMANNRRLLSFLTSIASHNFR